MKSPMTWFETNEARGFTLVEALVAVSILAITAAAPLFVASRAVVSAQTARDQLTASYLAQEGVEYVRTMRDNAFLDYYRAGGADVSENAWDDFMNGVSSYSVSSCKLSTCLLDPSQTMGTGANLSLTTCSGASCTPLYLSNGLYNQQNVGTPTPFTRTIQVTEIDSHEALVVSTVTWLYHGQTRTVSINTHLTQWQ